MQGSLYELKKKLRLVIAGSLVLSIYVAGVFASLLQHGKLLLNPFDLLALMLTGKYPWAMVLLIFILICVIFIWEVTKEWKESLYADTIGRNFKYSKEIQPYGNAHFAKPEEYADQAQVRPAKDCTGLILGQLTDDGTQCVDFNPQGMMNLFMVIFGTSGMGKSFGFVEPNLLQLAKQRRSIIVTDPSGELYTHLAAYFQQVGYKVRRFDLVTFDKTDGWDCLKFLCGLDENELSQKAQIFASSVVNNIGEGDSIYAEGATALLKAIILYVVLDKNTKEKTMKTVNEHLKAGSIQYYKTLFANACPDLKMATDAWSTIGNASENLLGNIITHLTVGLQTTQTPIVEEMLSTDDIDFEMCGQEPMVIFCRFSASDSTYKFITALFFTMGFYSLINLAEKQGAERENGSLRLDTPVTFMLDEFPSIGVIPNYDTIISNVRKYGLSIIMIAQNYPQFRKNYPYSEQSILDACSTQICLGTNNADTADYFSKRMGMMSIETESKSEDKNGTTVGNTNKGIGKAELMSGAEIMAMKDTEILIDLIKKPVIFAYKFPKFLHPEFKKTRNMKNSEIPGFYEYDRKAEVRRQEEENIRKWKEEHSGNVQPAEDNTEIKKTERIDYSTMSPMEIFTFIVRDDIQHVKDYIEKKRKQNQISASDITERQESEISVVLDKENSIGNIRKIVSLDFDDLDEYDEDAESVKENEAADNIMEDKDKMETPDNGFEPVMDLPEKGSGEAETDLEQEFPEDIPSEDFDMFDNSADIFNELFGDDSSFDPSDITDVFSDIIDDPAPMKEQEKKIPEQSAPKQMSTQPAMATPKQDKVNEPQKTSKTTQQQNTVAANPLPQTGTAEHKQLPPGAAAICEVCESPIDLATANYCRSHFEKIMCRRCQQKYRNGTRNKGIYDSGNSVYPDRFTERRGTGSLPKKS